MSNTRKMNELEELGRVDSEKAYTKKGKLGQRARLAITLGKLRKKK